MMELYSHLVWRINVEGCTYNNPCVQAPPPPPPRSPPPPTPKPPSNNCPLPPSGGSNNYPSVPTPPSQYIYMNGPPGNNIYPVDPYYTKNGASPIIWWCGNLIFIGSIITSIYTLWTLTIHMTDYFQ
ncbi:hypothetical protein LIER_31618 [Lithospermum erythrorhizon]|uniref:Uncharacterized protein n=1 Tax=Lithospermum erythrorhizon TaxID=34254 RepID=A0AAV3RTX9_LITER